MSNKKTVPYCKTRSIFYETVIVSASDKASSDNSLPIPGNSGISKYPFTGW